MAKKGGGQHETVAQATKFINAARELGCGEDLTAFEDKLRRIAKVKPKPEADAKTKDDEAPE